MKNKMLAIPMIVALLVGSVAASASPYGNRHRDWHDDGYATVTNVTPHYETYVRDEPRTVCTEDRYDNRDHSTRNGIIGAVVGGALGNQVGKGDGRKAATIGGAVLGGLIGAHHGNRDEYRYREGTRCRRTYEQVSYQAVNGYDIEYRYRGRYGYTYSQNYPEDGYIRIN